MINYEPDYIDRLNRLYESGKWLKTAILVEPGPVPKYWVDHEESITFQGHVYQPLPMFWQGIKTSVSMPIEGANVALSNIGNIIVKYFKTMDPSGLPVTLQLLHLDLLNTLTVPHEHYYKILSSKADQNVAVFTLGREFGRNKLPRRMIFPDQMP